VSIEANRDNTHKRFVYHSNSDYTQKIMHGRSGDDAVCYIRGNTNPLELAVS